MIDDILGITIPIAYIIIGSAIGFRVYEYGVERACRGKNEHTRHCDCNVEAGVIGLFWLLMIPVWVGYRISHKKKVGGIRFRRAERAAKRIADMEKEIFGD